MARQHQGGHKIKRISDDVKMALSEKIALLLHRHVDVPYSLVVT